MNTCLIAPPAGLRRRRATGLVAVSALAAVLVAASPAVAGEHGSAYPAPPPGPVVSPGWQPDSAPASPTYPSPYASDAPGAVPYPDPGTAFSSVCGRDFIISTWGDANGHRGIRIHCPECFCEQDEPRQMHYRVTSKPLTQEMVRAWDAFTGNVDVAIDHQWNRRTVGAIPVDLSPLAAGSNINRLTLLLPPPRDGANKTSMGGQLRWLRSHRGLTKLTVSWASLSPEDIRDLADAAGGLVALHLIYCDISGDGLRHLAKLEKLRCLDLQESTVSDESFRALSDCPALRHVQAMNTPITDAAFADNRGGWRSLELLDVSGTRLTEAGISELARLEKLKVLNVAGIRAGDSRLLALAEACPLQYLGATPTGDGRALRAALAQKRVYLYAVHADKPLDAETLGRIFDNEIEPEAQTDIRFALRNLEAADYAAIRAIRADRLACRFEDLYVGDIDWEALGTIDNAQSISLNRPSYIAELPASVTPMGIPGVMPGTAYPAEPSPGGAFPSTEPAPNGYAPPTYSPPSSPYGQPVPVPPTVGPSSPVPLTPPPASDPFGQPAPYQPHPPRASDDPFGPPAIPDPPDPSTESDDPFAPPSSTGPPSTPFSDDPFAPPLSDEPLPPTITPAPVTPGAAPAYRPYASPVPQPARRAHAESEEWKAAEAGLAVAMQGWSRSPRLRRLRLDDLPLTPSMYPHLAAMTGLEGLELLSTGTDDPVAKFVATLPNLKFLRLVEPNITDAAVAALTQSQTLVGLDLSQTAVTDKCVDELLAMPALKELHLHDSLLTQPAVERLRAKGIRVVWSPRTNTAGPWPVPVFPSVSQPWMSEELPPELW